MVLHHISLFQQDSLQLSDGNQPKLWIKSSWKIKDGKVYAILENKSDLSESVVTAERN